MSPKAYSYIRFSTPEQIKGDSLRRQTELSEKYAKEHGLVLDDSLKLQDLGLSAFSGAHLNKGSLGAFLKFVEGGQIKSGSVLIVESLDRLSRQEITEALGQFLAIIGKGVKLVTLADNREYTEETINRNFGELMYSLTIMARAHEESAMKAMRLGKAWENKRKLASEGTRKLTSKCPAWIEPDKNKLKEGKIEFKLISERARIIRCIFKMKLAGKGASLITKRLNQTAEWIPGERGKRKVGEGWRESYIKKILKNRSVFGEYQPRKNKKPIGEPIPDYYPAAVDKTTFFQVQQQFSHDPTKGGRTGRANNLFPHIVKCGYCGGSMAFIDKGYKGGKFFVCDRARRKANDCCSATIRYDEVERLVLSYCKGLKPKDILNENNDSELASVQAELDGASGELNSINERINNLTENLSNTRDQRIREKIEIEMIKYFDRQDELTKSKTALEQKIKRLSHSAEATQVTLNELENLFNFLSTTKADKLIDVRLKLRNEIKKLINKIYIFPEGQTRITAENFKKELKLASMLATKGSPSYHAQETSLKWKLERPKDFRCFRIVFTGGSFRFINPEEKHELSTENLKPKEVYAPSERVSKWENLNRV